MTTWGTRHLRPRDVFMLASLGTLGLLAGAVWLLGPAQDASRESALVGTVGALTTLAGYYLGNRGSEQAAERADAAQQASAFLRGEVETLRHRLSTLTAELDEVAEVAAAMDDAEAPAGERAR